MGRRGEAGGSGVRRRRPSATARDALLVSLSFAAGCVDALAFLRLGQVFVANMTGNTVLLGLAIGQWEGQAALRSGAALTGFVVGVAIGAAIAGQGRAESALWPPVVTAVLSLELSVIGAFAAWWLLAGPEPNRGEIYALVSLCAIAMGLQSIAVRRLGVPGVATTYITGTLTSLTERTIERLRTAGSAVAPGEHDDGRVTSSARGIVLPADVWLAYGVGAIVAGALVIRWPSGAILPPLAVVAAVIAFATTRHLRRDER